MNIIAKIKKAMTKKSKTRHYDPIQYMVFVMITLTLAICYITGRDLTFEAQSPVLGYILLSGITAVITLDLIQWYKHRKNRK